jgi:protein-glutamine gamma-glutamyltransferase
MRSSSDRPRLTKSFGISVLARTLALYLLFSQLWLHVSELVDFSFLSIALALAAIAAFFAEWIGFRARVAALFGALLPFAVRLVFSGFSALAGAVSPGPAADALLFLFDKSLIPSLIPVYWMFLSTFACLRLPAVLAWDPVADCALLVAIFWSQAGYRGSLYPHPGILGLVVGGFFILEVASLYAYSVSSGPASGGSRTRRPLVLVLVPLLALLFVVILSRYSEGAVTQGGGLIKPTLFRFDFSQYLKLEDEISLSNDLVLIVKKQGADEEILLRRYVLSGYSPNRGFYSDPANQGDAGPLSLPDRPTDFRDPGDRNRIRVEQEYYIVNFDGSSFIAMNYPVSVTPFREAASTSFSGSYSVVSKVSNLMPFDLVDAQSPLAAKAMAPKTYRYYTEFGDDAPIADLAKRVTVGIPGYYDRVMAVYSYLHDNYYYSLKPGVAEDGNRLHHFLFSSKKGYCSYFAFSMALMLRSLGIPCRVAVGFFLNPQVQAFGYYPVRADMAHAWVEVFYPGFGWIEYDPTSTTIAPGENLQFSQGMDTEQFSRLLKEILAGRDSRTVKSGTRVGQAEGTGTSGLLALIRIVARFWWLIAAVLYLGSVSVARYRHFASAAFANPPGRRALALYFHAAGLLFSTGYGKRPTESVQEFSDRTRRTAGIELGDLSRAYLKARYAPSFTMADLMKAREAYSLFLSSFRKTVPARRRAAGFLNPGLLFGRLS